MYCGLDPLITKHHTNAIQELPLSDCGPGTNKSKGNLGSKRKGKCMDGAVKIEWLVDRLL